MAKRDTPSPSALQTTAETIGSALGQIASRLDSWKKQRADLLREVQEITKAAQTMLTDLGHAGEEVVERVRKGGRQPGYTMSAATKAKLRAAWQKRKASMGQDAPVTTGTARTMSAEARAKIAAAQRARWAKRKNG